MSKKSRHTKAKRRAKSTKLVPAKHSQQPQLVAIKPQSPARVSHEAQDVVERYQYIKPELKSIGILAGAMILILIILSFVL
jgi:hypothetical protein